MRKCDNYRRIIEDTKKITQNHETLLNNWRCITRRKYIHNFDKNAMLFAPPGICCYTYDSVPCMSVGLVLETWCILGTLKCRENYEGIILLGRKTLDTSAVEKKVSIYRYPQLIGCRHPHIYITPILLS